MEFLRQRRALGLALVGFGAFFLAACGGGDGPGSDEPGMIDAQRLLAADTEPQSWLAHGRTYDEQRYSPLKQIHDGNVSRLELDWSFDTGISRGHEASPIVVDGVLYTTAPWSVVYALDARTGELLWKYDPQVPKSWGAYACCDVVNRGVAVWKGRVYLGTLDGYLVALDAATGQEEWRVLTVDTERPYTITGAPRIVKDKVIIGNGGAEYGVRGYVSAYDAGSGEMLWRFYTVPGNPADGFESEAMRQAARTWSGGKWWEIGGGGTVWDSMAYDPELDLLYIGTGNGSPWNRHVRSPGGGDNLFLSSMVALRPDTGEYVWHYQTTPGDTWDYTATQHMILADMEIDGQMRKVIMQAPKNGFFYVVDRETGEFLSAKPFVDLVTWATEVDQRTGRPVENPETNFRRGPKLVFPSPLGAHNWHPMAYHPGTGLVYIPAQEVPFNYSNGRASFNYIPGRWNLGVDVEPTLPPKDPAILQFLAQTLQGYLVAWDPKTQKAAWRNELGAPWNGGVLATGGNLVFQGTSRGQFKAYAADSGKELWSAEAQTGIIAPPVTYSIDGVQYVAVMVGYGGAYALTSGIPTRAEPSWPVGRLLVYSLEGDEELPPLPPPPPPPSPPEMRFTDREVAEGEFIFHNAYCNVCHGAGAVSTTPGVPDLRYMTEATHGEFEDIVLRGTREDKGMVSYADVLSAEEVRLIQLYLVSSAKAAREQLAGQ